MATTMLPPPPATEEDTKAPFILLSDGEELEEPPQGYRWMRCPSCEELHLRKSTARTEPLRDTPRTDTVPIGRPKR